MRDLGLMRGKVIDLVSEIRISDHHKSAIVDLKGRETQGRQGKQLAGLIFG
jgi:hypothetical protein